MDPTEQLTLADRPEYAKIKKELSAKPDSWMYDTNDFALRGEIPKAVFEQDLPLIALYVNR